MNLWHLIVRTWRERPARTAVSVASVAIAVAAVLGTSLSQSSVRHGVSQLSRHVDAHPALEIVSLEGGRWAAGAVPDLNDVPGVIDAIPIINRATLARVHGKRFRAVLVGLPLERQRAWELALTAGRACRQPGEAVVAAEIADARGAQVGDRLIVITRRGPRSATIVGLAPLAALSELAPAATLVMPLDEVRQFFGLAGQVDRVRVLVRSTDDREATRAAVGRLLPDHLVAQVPLAATETIDSTLRGTEMALRLAGALSLAMAAFIILNTLRLNFSERRRDMAVLRVLGVTRRQLLGLHVLDGLGLGMVGAALGVPLGIGLAQALGQAMARIVDVEVPASTFSWPALAFSFAVGPVVAVLAAAIPAFQSRKVSPIEALGEVDLRRAEQLPVAAIVGGAGAWCASVVLVALVVGERLPPQVAIPAGLLMLVGFIAVIPAVVAPLVRAIAWLLAGAMGVEGHLACEQLLARSTRTALTAGVLVVALAAGLGLGTAIINNVDDVRGWYRRTMSGDVFVADPAASEPAAAQGEQRDIGAQLAAEPGVDQVVEMRLLPTRANGVPAMCAVRDFVPQIELPWALPAPDEARLRRGLRAGSVALSRVMARKLGVAAGDTLRLEIGGRVHALPIAALVDDYVLGGRVAYIDQSTAERLVTLGPAEFFVVTAKTGIAADTLTAGLKQRLADEGVVVQSYAEMRRQLDRLINGVVGALWALLGVGFLIGGVAVANTLMMNVIEQTREIALLRIIGLTAGQVRKLIVCESLLLGVLGSAMGLLGGMTTAWVIHLCNEPVLGRSLPFTFHPWLLAANALLCIGIALVAAWRPSRWASRLNLLSAIAYE